MSVGKHSNNRSKIRHWLLVLTVRGMGGVAGALATWTTSRLLGADSAGVVFLALAIVTVLSTLSRLGLDNTVVRFVSVHASNENWTQVTGVLRVAMRWAGLASLAVAAVLFLSANLLAQYVFHMPALAPVLRIMAWLVPLIALCWLCAQGFVGLKKPEIATTLQNNCLPLGFMVLLGLGVIIAIPLRGELIAATAYLISGAVALVLGWRLWTRKLPMPAAPVDHQSLWQSAAPLWIVAVMGQAVAWSGQIASGIWLDASSVAHMAAAQRFAQLISLVLMVTNMLVTPRFATLHQQNKHEDLRKLARKTTRTMALVITPVVGVLIVFSAPIMSLFGEGFEAGIPLLRILIIGQWVNVITGSVSFLLQMTGHERDMRNISLLSGTLGIALALVLTANFGAIGAAWGTAAAIVIQNSSALLMVRYRLGFFTFW